MKINKRLHEEGTRAIFVTLAVVAATVILVNWLWPSQTLWHYLLYAFELVVLILTVRFFRVPIWRKTTMAEDAVLAPADGVIAANEEVFEDEYFHDKRRQISIFMSIYNVHINFFPFDGEVTYYKYHPGKFLLAFKPKSSTDNEHNTIVLKEAQTSERSSFRLPSLPLFLLRLFLACVRINLQLQRSADRRDQRQHHRLSGKSNSLIKQRMIGVIINQ